MISIEAIKTILFSDQCKQVSLREAVNKLRGQKSLTSFDDAFNVLFFEVNEPDLQRILAPFLRSRAVEHLETAANFTPFRDVYTKQHGSTALTDYFTLQKKNSIYGADEEAKALADLFNVSLQFTIVNREKINEELISYVAHEVAKHPIFHLYNQVEHHWYVYEGQPDDTLGDGNCLYNSFAQLLRLYLLEQRYKPSTTMSEDERNNVLNNAQKSKQEVAALFFKNLPVYQIQTLLLAGFDQLPRHTEEQLADLVRNLPSNETKDHLFSIEIAKTEPLLNAIDDMRNYGETLKQQGSSKGQVAINLAHRLSAMAENPSQYTENDWLTALTSQNKKMSAYRVSWNTIVKNIAIALTGIGIVFIAGKLLYSQATEGRALFFFQKNKTTCEEKRDVIWELHTRDISIANQTMIMQN